MRRVSVCLMWGVVLGVFGNFGCGGEVPWRSPEGAISQGIWDTPSDASPSYSAVVLRQEGAGLRFVGPASVWATTKDELNSEVPLEFVFELTIGTINGAEASPDALRRALDSGEPIQVTGSHLCDLVDQRFPDCECAFTTSDTGTLSPRDDGSYQVSLRLVIEEGKGTGIFAATTGTILLTGRAFENDVGGLTFDLGGQAIIFLGF